MSRDITGRYLYCFILIVYVAHCCLIERLQDCYIKRSNNLMRVKRILSQMLAGSILVIFTTTFIAACGSSSAAAVTTATVTATAANCFAQAIGTIKSISDKT